MKGPTIRQMRRMETKLAMDKSAAARRGLIVHGRFLERSTGSQVLYCPACNAPVVNSLDGRNAHRERTGCGMVKA